MSVWLRTLTLVFILLLVLGSHGSAQSFPLAVQQCIDAGVCSEPVSLGPLDSAGAVSGFTYLDSGVEKVLLRYEVLATLETNTNSGSSVETFRDVLWLSAQTQYDANAAEFHELVVFNDGTGSNAIGLEPVNALEITTDALLLATGETSLRGEFEFPPPVAPPSLLGFPLDLCDTIGCSGSASLNLIGLNYLDNNRLLQSNVEAVSSFPNDVLLIRNRTGFGDPPENEAFSDTLTVRLSAAAVPEPNSVIVILLGSVLVPLKRFRS